MKKMCLILPWMTFEVILHLIINLRLHNVDILDKVQKIQR